MGVVGGREDSFYKKTLLKDKYTLLLEHKILGTGLYGGLKIEILATVNLSLRGSSQHCLVPCFYCCSDNSVIVGTLSLLSFSDKLLRAI